MSPLTKEKAWVIFRADQLGHIEAKAALDNLSKEEFDAYECWAEEFDFEIAKIGVEAQNEAAALTEVNIVIEELRAKRHDLWTSEDYTNLVKQFEGSKYETLHLSALFRVPNNEFLLELVKP